MYCLNNNNNNNNNNNHNNYNNNNNNIIIIINHNNTNQLLSENKLYSLNSTYNFCALKNLQFRFQEKNLNLNRDSNLGSPDH